MGAKRDDILKLAQNGEERLLLSHLLDKQRQAEQYMQPVGTYFLDLHQQNLCRRAMQAARVTRYDLQGGFEGAERRCALFLPDYMEDAAMLQPEDLPFVALRVGNTAPRALTHRDYLGALMGLGIRREMVGDILVKEGGADLLVMGDIAPFVLQNLDKAGSAAVTCDRIPLDQLEVPQVKVKILRDTVPSLRLDAVLTVAFSLSRGDAADCIRRGLVQVDGSEMLKPDRPVEQGARIALRGKGKAILAQVGGQSKKGRTMIEVHKLI